MLFSSMSERRNNWDYRDYRDYRDNRSSRKRWLRMRLLAAVVLMMCLLLVFGFGAVSAQV